MISYVLFASKVTCNYYHTHEHRQDHMHGIVALPW
jgi:hypothetical protein